MQGAETEIIASHVAAGDVRIVYWPMLDLGPNATNAAIAAFCAGEQYPAAFWQYHDTLFEKQRSVYLANRDFFLETATSLGLDHDSFATCYDGDEMRASLDLLDQTRRRELEVSVRPTFDITGPSGEPQRIFGSQPFETFDTIIQGKLP